MRRRTQQTLYLVIKIQGAAFEPGSVQWNQAVALHPLSERLVNAA
ncbi:hypothetical protein N9Z47_00725 [bacterium]|nr:hypothetical protein [bacterium]